MTVYDLNRDQLTELKQQYYAEKTGEDLSYEELAFIDHYVSDEEVYDYYADTVFSPDDFFSDDDEVYNFVVMDCKGSQAYFLYATSGINYVWSDWAASRFNKRGVKDALEYVRKKGHPNAKAITLL